LRFFTAGVARPLPPPLSAPRRFSPALLFSVRFPYENARFLGFLSRLEFSHEKFCQFGDFQAFFVGFFFPGLGTMVSPSRLLLLFCFPPDQITFTPPSSWSVLLCACFFPTFLDHTVLIVPFIIGSSSQSACFQILLEFPSASFSASAPHQPGPSFSYCIGPCQSFCNTYFSKIRRGLYFASLTMVFIGLFPPCDLP